MRIIICAVAAGAGLLAGAVSPAFASAYKQFGQWSVYCSNALNCDMQFYSRDEKSGISSFKLHRDAGPNTPVSAAFSIAANALPDTGQALAVTVTVDKDRRIALDPSAVKFDKDRFEWTINADLAGLGVIDAMKTGHEMELTARTPARTAEGSIPLAGVSASLLYMDDMQDRVGRSDALISKGDKPPAAAPPLSEISRFDQFPKGMRAVFSDDGECGGLDESQLSAIGAFVHHLGDDEALYAAPCGSPGAYNAPFVLYYQTGNYLAQVQFPVMDAAGPSVMESAYNLDYDFKTRTLTSFFKGRGIGDCGSWYKWKVKDGGEGARLVLLEQREKDNCDGNYAGGPLKWPASWPPK